MTDDLVAFLRARLDEDETVARPAGEEGSDWYAGTPSGVWAEDGDPAVPVVYDEGRPTPEQAEHIARWDPTRALVEVEAKRRIIDLLTDDAPHSMIVGQAGRQDFRDGWAFAVLDTLRLLALPYAEHPDYRESWRP